MTELAQLLADCDARGIRMHPAGDTDLTIDAPHNALTTDLLEQLRARKADLLALLRPAHDTPTVGPVASTDAPAVSTKAVCRCGSTTWRDVPIHDGQSLRRDCGRCGRFIVFPVWYGKGTLHNAQ